MADPMAETASRAKGAAGEGKAAAGSPFRPVLAQNKEFAHYEVCDAWFSPRDIMVLQLHPPLWWTNC